MWRSQRRHGRFLQQPGEDGRLTNGASNTYLMGEKYLAPDNYYNGSDTADNESCYTGYDNDNCRTTYFRHYRRSHASRGRAGLRRLQSLRQHHSAGCNMALCDGSVRLINYSIDPETHRRLGNRKDGLSVDARKL